MTVKNENCMQLIKKQLINEINAITEDIRFFDVRGDYTEVSRLETCVENIKEQLEILAHIEKVGEGNIVHFNADGTFRLWCVRIPNGNEQVIEHYDVDISFDTYEELIEVSDCIDVTETFDITSIAPLIIVTETLSDKRTDVYYLIDDEAIDNMRS